MHGYEIIKGQLWKYAFFFNNLCAPEIFKSEYATVNNASQKRVFVIKDAL